jgi:hypothetical protein
VPAVSAFPPREERVGCTNSVVRRGCGAGGRSVGRPGSVGAPVLRGCLCSCLSSTSSPAGFALVLLLARSDRSKELELLVLRHELSILRRQARRPQRTESDRLLLAALSRVLPRRSWQAFLVTPETLLRWHRRIVACRWTYPQRRPGRPPVDEEVRQLILRLARENSRWGYVRIVGELRKLGIRFRRRWCPTRSPVPASRLHRSAPLPAGGRSCQHATTILACDLFTVDTAWLRRLYVLVFVSIGTRRVEYVACTSKPDGPWMTPTGTQPADGPRRPQPAAALPDP